MALCFFLLDLDFFFFFFVLSLNDLLMPAHVAGAKGVGALKTANFSKASKDDAATGAAHEAVNVGDVLDRFGLLIG
jgi:hypothetical protein